MASSRYARTPIIDFGRQYGTSEAVNNIRAAIKNGSMPTKQLLVRGVERLDTLAGSIYGDARYWWILAAASDVGWGLQVPPGTVINIPDLSAVITLVG
jgi:hypothetical protein